MTLKPHTLSQIESVLSQLNTAITLLDSAGNSLIPNDDIRYTLPPLPKQGVAVLREGRLFERCVSSRDLVLMTPVQDSLQVRDAFHLCDAMIGSMISASALSSDINSAWQRLLENELSDAEISAAADEYHIQKNLRRCVLILHMVQVRALSAREILEEITPRNPHDMLVSMDRHTAVLIKDAENAEDLEEIKEFAEALQETVIGETALGLTCGIGNFFRQIKDAHLSYHQARKALEVGERFAQPGSVHVYSYMLLERFLSDLSPEKARQYYSQLFNASTAKLFSTEMLETIDMFFSKDLNLSDTARQLYIHRNTLVYRLDKVQRLVGLDLRKFDDAVTFKLLYEMRKCEGNISEEDT